MVSGDFQFLESGKLRKQNDYNVKEDCMTLFSVEIISGGSTTTIEIECSSIRKMSYYCLFIDSGLKWELPSELDLSFGEITEIGEEE